MTLPFKFSLSGSIAEKTSSSTNFYAELKNFTLEGYIFDTSLLIITFEPANVAIKNKSRMRPGWGEHLLRSMQVSCLCVKANKSNWYLEPDLPEAFRQIKPFLEQFNRVVTYGGSMGGFGALTYADLLGADTVVSINPQSTLDRNLVPWEDRYPVAQEKFLDFSHPHADAVGKYSKARRVYIFADRLYDFDNKHLNRLIASNVIPINTPFIEHQVPEHLAKIGALNYIIRATIRDNFSSSQFYALMRKRRDLRRYYNVLKRKAEGRDSFLAVIEKSELMSPLLGQE